VPTNFKPAVDRINAAFPWLLQWNTHAACGEFLQRVCHEPECTAERVGLLHKDAGENGYTFPNGERTSHDVIAWPNGERVDVIQSAGGHPAPGGPAWGVIPPDQWRPSNVYVDIAGWPIYDSGTPHDAGPTGVTEVGFGWFCLMTALAQWPDEAKANAEWILKDINPSCFRVMLCVEGESHAQGDDPDVWTEAGVFIHNDWENRYKRMLDLVGGYGKQVHATVYGGRNQTPTEDDRRRFHDRIIAASQGRWEAIRSFECANEYKVNKWTTDEVRAMGRDLRAKLPPGFRLSLSSPEACHGGCGPNPTNEEMEASFDELYGGDDHAGANEITIHTMREYGNKWNDPFSYNFLYPGLPKINNEPPGPGASAGAEQTDAAVVARDLEKTKSAGWPLYMAHSEWCVWNGHLPAVYHNGYREVRYAWELPDMPAIADVLQGTTGEAEMPLPTYDEGWIMNTVRPAIVAKYDEHHAPVDDGYAAWVARTQYDYHAGMSQQDSLDKHLAELEAELAARPPAGAS
jgi:hypothetical protein